MVFHYRSKTAQLSLLTVFRKLFLEVPYNPYGDINTDYSKGPDIVRRKYTGQRRVLQSRFPELGGQNAGLLGASFASRAADNESGLYYYNARYYDPALGRFITADSIGNVGGANGDNRYMYVSGNPMKFNDPSGNRPKWWDNMMKDIKSAMIEHVVTEGTPTEKLLGMAYLKHEKKQQEKQERRNEMRQVAIQVAIIVVTIIVTVLSYGTGTEAMYLALQATLEKTAEELINEAVAGFIKGVAMDLGFQTAGRLVGGYWKGFNQWDKEGAEYGQQMGSNAAFAVSVTGIPALEEIGFKGMDGILQDTMDIVQNSGKDINHSLDQVNSAQSKFPRQDAVDSVKYYWGNRAKDIFSARNVLLFKVAVRESAFVYPSGKISEGLMNWFQKIPKDF